MDYVAQLLILTLPTLEWACFHLIVPEQNLKQKEKSLKVFECKELIFLVLFSDRNKAS